jgi:hypothetical protein
LHGDYLPNQIKYTWPSKHDIITYGTAFATVFTEKKIAFASPHETGEDKKPRRKAIAVPTPELLSFPAVKTGRGAIQKKFKPASLLHGKSPKGLNPFEWKGLVLTRIGKDRYPLMTLYGFEPRVRITPRWLFESSIRALIPQVFSNFFNANMDLAIRTMR